MVAMLARQLHVCCQTCVHACHAYAVAAWHGYHWHLRNCASQALSRLIGPMGSVVRRVQMQLVSHR